MKNTNFSRGMKQVRDAVKEVVRSAAVEGDHHGAVNVARRTNIKVAENVGHGDGTARASAIQVAPIVQRGDDAPA